jgi:hypothetical protein
VAFGGKGERGRWVLGWRTVGVGVAALVLVVGGVVWLRLNTAEAAVGGFLAALARGDATAALSYAANTPDDTSLLTDVVLAESIKMAPITDIEVAENAAHDVVAKYHLGGAPVTATYDTVKVGAVWKLSYVTTRLGAWPGSSAFYGNSGFALQINGAAVAREAITVFPGSYRVTSPDDRFEVLDNEFTVGGPEDTAVKTSSMALTDKGVADLLAAAKASLATCLEQKTVHPTGCELYTSVTAVDSTIEWAKLSDDAIPAKYVSRRLTGDYRRNQAWIDFPTDHDLELPFSCKGTDGVRKTGSASVSRIIGEFSSTGVTILVNER